MKSALFSERPTWCCRNSRSGRAASSQARVKAAASAARSKLLFVTWTVIGLVIYFLYGYRHSNVARGIVEVPEVAADAPGSIGVAPMPGAPVPPQDRD